MDGRGRNTYIDAIKGFRAKKKLGQNFLVNVSVAEAEANFGIGRTVIEIGPGFGILTKALSAHAKKVIAVERDAALYAHLSQSIRAENVELINGDFFKVKPSSLKGADIVISNIPYSLSSKVLFWLMEKRMPAVLCLQKEFVEHMMAGHGTRSYSKLSVASALQFTVSYILDVPRNDFFPQPRVDSSLVYLKPKPQHISKETMEVISLIMMHKKKLVRNALADSSEALGIPKERIREMHIPGLEERALHLSPEEILSVAEKVSKRL